MSVLFVTDKGKRRRRNATDSQQRVLKRQIVEQFFVVFDLTIKLLRFQEKIEWEVLFFSMTAMRTQRVFGSGGTFRRVFKKEWGFRFLRVRHGCNWQNRTGWLSAPTTGQ